MIFRLKWRLGSAHWCGVYWRLDMTKTGQCCAAVALLVNSGASIGGGLWLNEYGDFSGGRAGAGAAAGVDEAMTIAYNPASITRIEGNQLFVSAGAIFGEMNFDVNYSNPRNGEEAGGDAGNTVPAASMAYVHDLGSDKWSAGIALGGLSGAGMDYDHDWVGRYQATEVSLLVMALSPTVAYQANDKLSLGISVQALYADLDLDFAVPRVNPGASDGEGSIDGDDFQPGYALGVLYELPTGSRFGLFYQSEIEIEFDGEVNVNLPFENGDSATELARSVVSDTELTLAEYVRFSVHQDMNERWGVDLTVGWDNWSALNNVLVSTQDGASGIPTQWRDTYHYAWGAQYKLDEHWDLTGGISYDTNPVKAKNRIAQLPVDRQIRYAFGVRYKLRDTLTVGSYVNYMDLGDARITSERFGGDFEDNNAIQLIANLNWKF